MNFLPFLIWPLVLLSFILIIGLIFNKLGIKDFGVIFSSAHLLLICVLSLIAYLNLHEAQIEFIWFIPMILDFPLMFFYSFMLEVILSLIGYSKSNSAVIAPLIFFGTFGTLLYYLVGKVIHIFFINLKKYRN